MKHAAATFLSVVFHPLLVPTYLAALVVIGSTPTQSSGSLTLGVVAGCTFGLPALGTGLLYYRGRLESFMLQERRQRYGPLLLTACCFGLATYLVTNSPGVPRLLPLLLGGMTVAVLLTFLITFWWKISAHGVGMGGALATLLMLGRPSWGWAALFGLALGLTAAAAVAWARLALQAHTRAQVWAGLLLGLTTGLAVILLGGAFSFGS
ncbi:hypothetical protein HER32_09495 [Hymenobacter sp. BT18]|uniref:hypothetical protein n=1 Tax=Hymenobacter sp. BT18 TaxID=2835648 RepID=UPI00143E5EBD|nr:hypothetical protein [Hymenobacter sp. BT18]QIX61398.1 hypothetical protein HER32_09495 [Hymenobacter sp. BT18]